MALPTDPAESFVREVDENLRRDQMRDMAKNYGGWIVAGIIVALNLKLLFDTFLG